MTPETLGGLARGELVEMVLRLVEENQRLAARVAALEAAAGKNSGNSSKPPSRDPAAERERQAEARRQRRAKQAGGKIRRQGKQPGAAGKTLQMTDSPDDVVVHAPQVCAGCGGDLAEAEVTGVERRQVTEVPVVVPTVTEHRRERRRCGCCGTVTAGVSPIMCGPR
ncbi:MAG: DUF6444 domain-containing protein [Acidimicrobiales bacterium]